MAWHTERYLALFVDKLWLFAADSHSPPVHATCENSGGTHCDLNEFFLLINDI